MYKMWKLKGRYITVWVKGKYYENPIVGTFMELTSNLPTVSRGYIITKEDFGAFPRYDYISRTSLGERTAEIYVKAVLAMIAENPKPAAP